MYWRDFSKEKPPSPGRYMVLWLKQRRQGPRWALSKGRYYDNGIWELFLDDFGWTFDSGVEVAYWFELPTYPPLPYEGPVCEYFKEGYCWAQKNAPQCFCQGDKNKCDK